MTAICVPLALAMSNMLSAMVAITPPPFFPEMSRALGVSVPVLGQVMTATLFVAAALSVVIGPLADRHGLRRLLLVGAVAATASMLGFGLAPTYPVLLLTAVFGGLASATPPGLSLAVARTSLDGQARRRAIGWLTAGSAVAAIAAVPLMALMAHGFGWRMAFIGAGLFAASVTAVIAWFLPSDRPLPDPCAGPRTLMAAYAPLLGHRPTLRVYGVTVLRSICWFGMLGYFGAFMGDHLGLDARWIGIAYMLSGSAYVTGSLTAGRVLVRLSLRVLIAGTNIAIAATVGILFGTVTGAIGAVALLTVIGLLGALSNIGTITLLSEEAPGGAGTVMTLNAALTNLGAAAGGALGGVRRLPGARRWPRRLRAGHCRADRPGKCAQHGPRSAPDGVARSRGGGSRHDTGCHAGQRRIHPVRCTAVPNPRLPGASPEPGRRRYQEARPMPYDPHSPDADPTRPVNTPTAIDGQVTLVDYDPAWPAMFAREAERIRGALGDRAVMREHVGSTSVPGLIAKPCIDILLVVVDAGDDDAYIPDLQRAGYVLRISEDIDDWGPHRVLKGPEINLNLHVLSVGSPEVDRFLAFRDWLRTHPEDHNRYADAKRELASRHWRYMQEYADAKDDVVREIFTRIEGARVAG